MKAEKAVRKAAEAVRIVLQQVASPKGTALYKGTCVTRQRNVTDCYVSARTVEEAKRKLEELTGLAVVRVERWTQ